MGSLSLAGTRSPALTSRGQFAPRIRRGYIESLFTALRHFALEDTGHASHQAQACMIGRYIIWRNSHAYGNDSAGSSAGANVA